MQREMVREREKGRERERKKKGERDACDSYIIMQVVTEALMLTKVTKCTLFIYN